MGLFDRFFGPPNEAGFAKIVMAELRRVGVVALVYDLPTTMGFVSADKLEEWGVSLYEAMEAAQRNLESLEYAMMGLGGPCTSSRTATPTTPHACC